MGEQFAVLLFFDDGKRKYARRFVSAGEACGVFEHCIHSPGARSGRTARVIITDRNDCVLREWKFGDGLEFPPQDGRRRNRPVKKKLGV